MDNLDTTFQKLRRLHESIIKNEAEWSDIAAYDDRKDAAKIIAELKQEFEFAGREAWANNGKSTNHYLVRGKPACGRLMWRTAGKNDKDRAKSHPEDNCKTCERILWH